MLVRARAHFITKLNGENENEASFDSRSISKINLSTFLDATYENSINESNSNNRKMKKGTISNAVQRAANKETVNQFII